MNRDARSPALAMAILAAAIGLLVVAGCRERPVAAVPGGPSGQTVQLMIDYGDGGQKRFAAIPWHDGLTVLDALEAAKQNPHGITFATRGTGEGALLTKLDDLANEEGAAGAKNWLFYINDRLADKSLGAATLKSGDTILWKFERYVE